MSKLTAKERKQLITRIETALFDTDGLTGAEINNLIEEFALDNRPWCDCGDEIVESGACATCLMVLKDRAEKAEENYQFMVNKACTEELPKYREMGDKLCAMEEARDEAIAQRDAAINLRELDTEFVCAFLRTVRELECRCPPVPAERWIKAAEAFLDKNRTEPVAVPPYDNSWKDTWDRAEKAERERDKLQEAVNHVLHANNPPSDMTGPEVCDWLRGLLQTALEGRNDE